MRDQNHDAHSSTYCRVWVSIRIRVRTRVRDRIRARVRVRGVHVHLRSSTQVFTSQFSNRLATTSSALGVYVCIVHCNRASVCVRLWGLVNGDIHPSTGA